MKPRPTSSDHGPVDALAEEFLARHRRGDRPTVDEYAERHPQWADEIRENFPALLMMEQFKPAPDDLTGSHPALPVATGRLPDRLGEYRILREVGRGGMGVVYEAVQEPLGRHVALKVLPWQGRMDSAQLERFRLEASSAARLHHTHIVPVFGVGEHDGVHYYSMQFIHGTGLDVVLQDLRRLREEEPPADPARVPGEALTVSVAVAHGLLDGRAASPTASLDEASTETSPSSGAGVVADQASPSAVPDRSGLSDPLQAHYYRSVARIGVQVAEALAYAHDHGVLHRDIKPSNLLLDAGGQAWVTDFGLAKLEGSEGPTRTGDIVGTLRYMAPERFAGRSDPRSDVYGLGATLYELLALRPAFDDGDRARLIDRVLHEPATPPRRLDPHVPRDLETIVLKAMTKEPGDRFPSAEALRDELRRFVEGRPIRSRPTPLYERFWRWGRRNPAVAGLLVAVLALLVAGTVATGLAADHFRRLAGAESVASTLASRRAAEAQAAGAAADAKAREAQAVADFLILDLIGAAAPGKGQGTEMTIVQALARADALIDARFGDQPLLAAAIHQRMGETYSSLEKQAEAQRHFAAAAELRAKHLGPDARETLRSRQRQVVAIRNSGDREAARALGVELLERQRRALGPEDPDTLVTMQEIGQLLFPYSDDRAPRYYRNLYETLARVEGPEAMSTVNALQWYACTFQDRGDPECAADLFIEALEIRLRTRGELDGATFWTANDMFPVLLLTKRYEVAWTYASRLWPAMCRNLDPSFSSIRTMTENVLRLAAATPDWARAESLFRRGASDLAADLGPGHIRTLSARASLARALAEQGRADEALTIAGELLEALPGHEAGPNPEVVLEHVLAAVDRARGPAEKSEEASRKLHALGEQFARSGESLMADGKAEQAANSLLQAIRLGADAPEFIERLETAAGGSASRVRAANALYEVGQRLDGQDQLDRAIAAYRASLRLDPEKQYPACALGHALERRGDLEGALPQYRKAIRLEPTFGYPHLGIARILLRQGDSARARDELREAMRLEPTRWEVYPLLAPLDSEAVEGLDRQADVPTVIRNNVAWRLIAPPEAWRDLRRVDLAVRLARSAVEADPGRDVYRNTLGVALHRAGDFAGAIAELEQSVHLDPGESHFAHDGFFLAMDHWRLGDRARALAYFDRSVAWSEACAPTDPELPGFRAEAEALLDTTRPRPHFREILGDLSAEAYSRSGMALGAQGQWDAALGALRQACADRGSAGAAVHVPPSHVWLFLAALELEAGDPGRYRRHCRRMLDRFGTSNEATDLERTAKAGLLAPPRSPEEAERLRSLARAAAERGGPDPGLRAWLLMALGLAEYRAGDADAAVEALDRCLGLGPGPATGVPALAIEAMALDQLGQIEAAEQRLGQAERLMADSLATVAAPDWPDRLVAHRLVREAQAVVRFDRIFPTDPFAP